MTKFAFCVPSITEVTGTFSGDAEDTGANVVTITGSGFGTKTTAAPLVWYCGHDNTGNPTALGTKTSWDGAGYAASQASVVQSGAYAAGSSAGWRTSPTGFYIQANMTLAYGGKYYSFKHRYTTQTTWNTATSAQNTKLDRCWYSAIGSANQNWYLGTQVDSGTGIWIAEQIAVPVTNVTRFYTNGTLPRPTASVWRAEKFIIQQNSELGASDGVFDIFVGTTSQESSSGWKMDEAGKPGPNNIYVFQQVLANNSGESWCNSGDAYFDNIYLDTYWQRVELNGSTLNKQSMLIPKTWSDTEITAYFHQAGFSENDLADVTVYDVNGASDTFQITIGASEAGGGDTGGGIHIGGGCTVKGQGTAR